MTISITFKKGCAEYRYVEWCVPILSRDGFQVEPGFESRRVSSRDGYSFGGKLDVNNENWQPKIFELENVLYTLNLLLRAYAYQYNKYT
jgi:hypothetical protein